MRAVGGMPLRAPITPLTSAVELDCLAASCRLTPWEYPEQSWGVRRSSAPDHVAMVRLSRKPEERFSVWREPSAEFTPTPLRTEKA